MIFKNLIENKDIFILSFLTAYLLSIRIAGVLILIQYLVLFLLFLNLYKKEFLIFFKDFYLKLLFFVFGLIFFTYLLYPIFWIDPYFLFETIKINANHFNNVGTLNLVKLCIQKIYLQPI